MGPINQNAMTRGLLDWFGDDRPVVDRATLLPIGQYEDGGLTFAWPGFLKDAWEGAQRTYLDAGNVPVPDAVPGTRWSSNVDALNAASIAPMAGVAGRAAGAGVGMRAAASVAGEPVQARAWRGVYDADRFSGNDKWLGGDGNRQMAWFADNPRTASVYTGEMYGAPSVEGSAIFPADLSFSNARIVDAGRKRIFDLDVGQIIDDAARGGHDGIVFRDVVDNGPGGMPMRQDQYLALQPGTARSPYTGELLFANDSRAALPALMAQPQGLLGGEPQPALPPLFASAEPYLLERPTEPVMGPFEMPGRWDFPFDLDRQKWQDERYQSPIDLPAPEDQFRPTFRPFAGLMR